jgi:16S rRNA (uracil1498-N3)-methyltransferase
LEQLGRGAARVEILDRSNLEPPPRLPIHLGIGLSKGERMDLAVQKSVELGVTAVTPLITDRCVVRLPPQRMVKREEHWRGIIISACGQSGRNLIPNLHPACSLEEWLEIVAETAGLLLDHRSSHTLDQLREPVTGLSLLAGPEGGLSDKERSMATDAGFTGIRLGPRVLRTETAPLAAIAAIQMLWGDFKYLE